MNINLDKYDLINLVRSIDPINMQMCDNYTKLGFMKFTGNQWNEKWDWIPESLTKLSEKELIDLYQNLKYDEIEYAKKQNFIIKSWINKALENNL